MTHRSNCTCFVAAFLLALAAILGAAAPLPAASAILAPAGDYAGGYLADDYFTDQQDIKAFDVSDNRVVTWDNSGARILNRTTGAVEEMLGTVPQAYLDAYPDDDIWNSFTTFDPDDGSVWIGFIHQANIDDRIYHVAKQGDGSWQWTHTATLTGNHEMVFHGGEAYASANPAAPSWGTQATLYRLDTTMPGGAPASSHDIIATVGGYSAGLALDADGNVYYGSYHLTSDWSSSYGTLYQFEAADVAGGGLDLLDAVVLANLPSGAADVEVDPADNVLFAMNPAFGSGTSQIAIWDGEYGSGHNYDVVAQGIGAKGNFFPGLKASGDFTADGILYVNDSNFSAPFPGLAGIKVVPEPNTCVLALSALLMLFIWRRRRR